MTTNSETARADRLAAEVERLRAQISAALALPHAEWCCGTGCQHPYHGAHCPGCDCHMADVRAALT